MSLHPLRFLAFAALATAAASACGGKETEHVTTTGTETASGGAGGAASGTTSSGATTTTTASTGGSGGTTSAPPGAISVSKDSVLEAETHLAVAPTGLLAVAWIAEQPDGGSTNGYVFSTDRGDTWGPVQQLASPNGQVASDPVLAVDAQNNFYMTWIGFKFDAQGNAYDMHVYAATAPAGTTTFGAPVEVTQGTADDYYDKPWIAVSAQGTILVTYAKTSTGGIYVGRSSDQGQTWSNVMIVEDGGFRNLVYPCLPADSGRIYVSYHAGGGIGLRWSDDDGLTWPDVNKTAVAASGETPAFDDPTCVAAGNDVWVSYGLSKDTFGSGSSPKLDSIRIAHSSDGGATFPDHTVAHDATAAPLYQHPQLALDSGGRLHVVYYAGAKEGDKAGSLRRSTSADGGATWTPSVVVHEPIVFTGDRTSTKWLGDYIGVAWSEGEIMTSYVDNTAVYSHIAFAKVATP